MRFVTRSLFAPAAVAAAVAALAACDAAPEPAAAPSAPAASVPATAPANAAPALAIEGEGLRLVSASGSTTPLAFGAPRDVVIAAVAGSLGQPAPAVTTNTECGAGPTQFAQFDNGLDLAFQNDAFAGWTLDAAGPSTMDGVAVGVTRPALAALRTVEMVPESTLGAEFTAGDVSGFFESAAADSRIESLYAGLTCFFR